MVEPRIQYAKTSDGVSIAYYVAGRGRAIVTMPMLPWSHIGKDRDDPLLRPLLGALGGTMVRYDNRGSGLSAHDVDDYSLDGHMRDLEAVVDQLDLDRFALLGRQHSVPVAIAYAARHPSRVSRLVLWSGYAKGADFGAVPQVQSVEAMLDRDWNLFIQTAARIGVAFEDEELSREVAAFFRECVTQERAIAVHRARRGIDVSELLARVSVPTLVIHPREWRDLGLEIAKDLASGIPGASLVVEDLTGTATAISAFLDDGGVGIAGAPAAAGLVTILFTDIESSTALRRELGDAQMQELVRAHDGIVRAALGEHGGREIKHTGDGIMASFGTASAALRAAIAIQRGVEQSNVGAHGPATPGGPAPLQVYVGLNAGEPIAEEQDLFGTSVDLARRICDHAEPGQILASNVVRELAEGKGFLFSDIGDVMPKGFEQPVRLYEVRWREEA